MKTQFVSNKIKLQNLDKSYKIGLNEVVGLETEMRKVLRPIEQHLQDVIYWNPDENFKQTEYLSRDGFIPYNSNCGGLEYWAQVPKCEEDVFAYLKFGNHDEDCAYSEGEECSCGEYEGYLDAKLRIWFKFEGIDENTGKLQFYLVLSGGNGDAPYFRENHSSTYFEASFECSSVAGLSRAAAKHVRALQKFMGF